MTLVCPAKARLAKQKKTERKKKRRDEKKKHLFIRLLSGIGLRTSVVYVSVCTTEDNRIATTETALR
jgi:hypothetical protein